MKLNYLQTYNAVADAILKALREYESIALEMDAQVNNDINLNLREIDWKEPVSRELPVYIESFCNQCER